ncbi:cGMP-gated channel, putative, partial [Trichomonas vaginalis G3]
LFDRDDTDWKDEVQQKFLECKEGTCAVLEDEIENRIDELLKDKELLHKYGSEKFDITPPEKKKREKKEKKVKEEKKVEEEKKEPEPVPEKKKFDM